MLKVLYQEALGGAPFLLQSGLALLDLLPRPQNLRTLEQPSLITTGTIDPANDEPVSSHSADDLL